MNFYRKSWDNPALGKVFTFNEGLGEEVAQIKRRKKETLFCSRLNGAINRRLCELCPQCVDRFNYMFYYLGNKNKFKKEQCVNGSKPTRTVSVRSLIINLCEKVLKKTPVNARGYLRPSC